MHEKRLVLGSNSKVLVRLEGKWDQCLMENIFEIYLGHKVESN